MNDDRLKKRYILTLTFLAYCAGIIFGLGLIPMSQPNCDMERWQELMTNSSHVCCTEDKSWPAVALTAGILIPLVFVLWFFQHYNHVYRFTI